MPADAVVVLHGAVMGPESVEYLRRMDETLAPFAGRSLIHREPAEVLEGTLVGDLVVVAFPDGVRGWYASPSYRVILPLRTWNASGPVILLDGVGEDHRATDILPV